MTIKTQAPFWMIYVKGQPPLVTECKSLEEAQDEAQRIAVKTGKETYVMSPVGGYFSAPEPIEIAECKA